MLRAWKRTLLCLLALLPVLDLSARLRQNDFSLREKRLSSQRVPIKKLEMEQNREIGSRRFTAARWEGALSSLAEKRAPIELREKAAKRVQRKKALNFSRQEPRLARQSGKRAKGLNLKKRKKAGLVSKYRDASVVSVDSNPKKFEKALGELSLQDINRFSFRKSHSKKPGLPVQKAGRR